ncbi:hypothetical protein PBRA_006819 [Plasmodiophora brassicae]|uniref:tRNA(Ile)-lysidine/2-thiocytidine synthase N-terminal domain-containing protein n=1 Tax=Plasmodiophora brassicae TaxID=37360 RepID=A0A0G4ITX6_PLABS|nr:hypothetical protein PBRA_006819 [Plasmodiophora brassicae]
MKESAPRQFSHLDEDVTVSRLTSKTTNRFDDLLDTVRSGVIGHDRAFSGPYGKRRITYADYVASGRALRFIEQYIVDEVLPVYGNTHTTSSHTGVQTTLYRSEARSAIGRAVNSDKDDVVLFCGSGATSAISTLVHILSVSSRPTVVLSGPYEHHSNLLPWRESGATIVTVRESVTTGIDLGHLEEVLSAQAGSGNLVIGAFSAASNITGVLTDTLAITRLLDRFNALSVFDYACAAPYVPIDMHEGGIAKTAIAMSPHKLVGGVGAPGVLVVNKSVLINTVPNRPGGGTVFFVRSEGHRYLSNFVEREEGGTPDIVGSIRAGMAFDLRAALDPVRIHAKDREYVMSRWREHDALVILGDKRAPRLPIFSVLIRAPDSDSMFLHHNFVSALLNDLFGVQTRGGCACAGPYAQRLMGIDDHLAKRFEDELLNKSEVVRPGFVRLNFSYFASEEEVELLVAAVLFVAEHGWKFLPDYAFLVDTGEWRQRSVLNRAKDRRWLSDISYANGRFEYQRAEEDTSNDDMRDYMDKAHALMHSLIEGYPQHMADSVQVLPEGAQDLRWFMTPSEALERIRTGTCETSLPCLIDPRRYRIDGPTPSNVSATTTVAACPARRPMVLSALQCVNCFHIHGGGSQCLSCECVHYAMPAPVIDAKLRDYKLDRLCRTVSRAMFDFKMLSFDGDKPDRVLVAVSGGKDSLTLVDILLEIRRRSGRKFDIGACTVDPMTPEYDPSPLKDYFKQLGVPYFYEQQAIIEQAKTCMRVGSNNRVSICSFCSRMKRGVLYHTARREGYNVLAMGQHLDDLAESFMMSAFHNGVCNTMKANYHVAEGDIRVVRPLVYVRERALREYAKIAALPVIFENCPACFEAPKERQRVKVMLAAQEHIHPNLFSSLMKCMRPLMARENSRLLVRDESPPCDDTDACNNGA